MSDYALPSLTATEALSTEGAVWLDLRRPEARQASGLGVQGAVHCDPLAFDHSHPLTMEDRPIVVFCAHGHELSQYGCALLRVHKRTAHYISGGFEALMAAGARVIPLD